MPGDSLKNIIPIIKDQKEETTFNQVQQKLKNENLHKQQPFNHCKKQTETSKNNEKLYR